MSAFWYSANFLPTDEQLKNIKLRGQEFDSFSCSLGHFAQSFIRWKEILCNEFGVLLYNGTTYNANNDYQWIVDQLNDNVEDCLATVRQLDGEYSLVWAAHEFVVFAKDQFGTKPLHCFYEDDVFCVSTYPDIIRDTYQGSWPVEENKIYVYNKNGLTVYENTTWDLTQHKQSYNDLHSAWELAIDKRFSLDNDIVFLSAGVDSGCISCYLESKGYTNFSISWPTEKEDKLTLAKRVKTSRGRIAREKYRDKQKLDSDVESMQNIDWIEELTDAGVSRWHGALRELQEEGKYTSIISGNGMDALYYDRGEYGRKFRYMSKMGGYFPKDLSLVWPWHTNLGKMQSLFASYDILTASFGFQSKYPGLDKQVFQEFLWLDSRLKNAGHKRCFISYLEKYNYPYFNDKILNTIYNSRK